MSLRKSGKPDSSVEFPQNPAPAKGACLVHDLSAAMRLRPAARGALPGHRVVRERQRLPPLFWFLAVHTDPGFVLTHQETGGQKQPRGSNGGKFLGLEFQTLRWRQKRADLEGCFHPCEPAFSPAASLHAVPKWEEMEENQDQRKGRTHTNARDAWGARPPRSSGAPEAGRGTLRRCGALDHRQPGLRSQVGPRSQGDTLATCLAAEMSLGHT